jgi:hypothetical protein
MSDIDEVGESKHIPKNKFKRESILWQENIQKKIDSFEAKFQKFKINKRTKYIERNEDFISMKDILFKSDTDVNLMKQLYEFLKKKLNIFKIDKQT